MDLNLVALVATCLLAVTAIVLGGSLLRSPTDVILVYLLVFSQFYGLRPLLFVLGLDTPSPDNEFFASDSAGVLATAVLGVTLFLALVLLGVVIWGNSGLPAWGPCFSTGPLSLPRMMRVTLVLTAGSIAISTYLVASQGGVGNLISAAKFDQALAGLFVLRIVPSIGAVVAVAMFLEAHSTGGQRLVAMLGLACAVVNAFSVFLWGSRSVLVVIAATVVLGLRNRGARTPDSGATAPSHTSRSKIILRLSVAVVLVIALAGGLRIARDTLTQGEVLDVYAEAGTARQVSLATNATYFDAAMLSFRDWPDRRELRNGEDFYTGLVAFVPRAFWSEKPESIAPGRWFRQVYQPDKANGWPMGAAALWYLNFGWIGLALGGLVSGLLLGAVSKAQRRSPDHGFNRGVAIMVGVFVIGLGWDSDSLLRIVIWVGPLWLIARYVTDPPQYPGGSDPSAATVTEPHSNVVSLDPNHDGGRVRRGLS